MERLSREQDLESRIGCMAGGELIVCESCGTWGIRLRRILRPDDGWRIRETRSPTDCWQQLTQHPTSLVAWEGASMEPASLAERLIEQSRRFPRAPSVVLCTRELARFARLWREAGAMHVVRSPRELPRVLGIARRHRQRYPQREPALQRPAWRQLPWGPPHSDRIASIALCADDPLEP
jgi:hypothetical protein